MKINWSEKVADNVLNNKIWLYDTWDYDNAIVLEALIRIWRETGNEKYLTFCKNQIDKFVLNSGNIKKYDPYEYNLEYIANGKILFELYRETGIEKYKKAIFNLRAQLKRQPRTKEGAFCYKKSMRGQLWLDGIYMSVPFYAEFIKSFAEVKNYDDVTKQFYIAYNHLINKETGLLYHAWDEMRDMFWANKQTGTSACFNARGIGLFLMGLVDTLEFLPEDNKDKKSLKNMLVNILKVILNYQDESGCWYFVLNQEGRKGNYIESSASCMFLYALVSAYNRMYINECDRKRFLQAINKAYNGIIDEFVLITNEGYININKVCRNSIFGNKDRKDGSYTYYISEPVVCNDLKGVGAFISAMFEYEKMMQGKY